MILCLCSIGLLEAWFGSKCSVDYYIITGSVLGQVLCNGISCSVVAVLSTIDEVLLCIE